MVSKYLLSCAVLAVFAVDAVSSVAIYKDTDVIKKSHRTAKQSNDFPLYEDDDSYSQSRHKVESRWESAEWPQEFDGTRGGQRRDNSYESEEHPYNWYYYNKFITNGRFNHLYNGPHLDNQAGIGDSGNQRNHGAPPRVLPRPVPIYI